MKKILTMMLLALLCSIAAQAQDADYQPLVREGVVWHYEYFLFDDYTYESFAEDYKVQFRGDTLLNGVLYKKCFFYKEQHLPCPRGKQANLVYRTRHGFAQWCLRQFVC